MADRSAFQQLYDLTAPQLFAVALRVLGDHTEAEDCLHELFTALWDDADLFRSPDLSPMARVVTDIRAAAIARKRVRYSAPDRVDTRELFGVAGLSDAPTEQDNSLQASISALQPARATLLRRVCLNGDGYDDLARASDVDAPTVRRSLQKALQTIGCSLMTEDQPSVPAAEYALCLLPEDEAVMFEAQMSDDADLARQVAVWHAGLSDYLRASIPETPPPAQLARRLQASLFSERRETLWQQLWPYAIGGIIAALVLWFAVSTDVLVPLQ
nr:sigma factor [Marivita sp. S6314]